MNRKNIIIPLELITDERLSPTAKVIYAVLKSFQKGKIESGSALSVTATHAEINDKSNLSKHTVVKALNMLAETGWIERERNSGSANKYIFTAPWS